jgi:hypothetical protein
MRVNGPRASRGELVLLAALTAWGLLPIVLLLARAAALDARFTGADGLIGADGVLGADQLQYLAWIRDAGAHGLASDLFSLSPSGHVYLQPLFTISGALLHLGLSLPVAYLVWKPVAILAMFAAAVTWARRFFGDRLGERAAAVTLSLFLSAPLAALVSWTQSGPGPFRFQIYQLGGEMMAAGGLWGYVPGALAFALVPLALLAIERSLDPPMGTATRHNRPAGASRLLAAAAAASLVASWLHPWQGVTLILIFAGLAIVRRFQGWLRLLLPALAAAIPLGYYDLLSHTDSAWRLAARLEATPRFSAVVMLAALGPLALIAALGVRRPNGVVIEQALLLWVGACFLNYFVNESFPPHALQGLSLPLAILMVRGWDRLALPVVVGIAAIGLVTIPGLAYDARKFVRTARSSSFVQYYLPASDARALDWITDRAPAGGVLAPTPLALVVPSQTGRAVWVGHGYWSVDYFARSRRVDALVLGRMSPGRARAFVSATGASIVLEGCSDPADLGRMLGPLIASAHRFGCARVYVISRAHRTRSARR